MIRNVACVLALGGAVLLACGGDDDEAKAKYPTADAFCAAKAAEECKAVAASCSVGDEKCKEARKSACLGGAGQATGEGRSYQSGNAEACISKTTDVYSTRTIDPTKEDAFEESCAKVFAGTKKKNDACVNKYDCEGSLLCDTAKGFCADKVTRKDGEGCNNPGEICDKGLYCKQNGGAKFCAPRPKLGESCNLTDTPCTEDLRCNATSCVAKMNAGDPCDTGEECSTGFCNADRKCQAKQFASETGTCKDFGGT